FYGISDAFARPEQTSEAMSTILMAPAFREAMITFWVKTARSIDPRTFRDPAFAANRKYIVGSAITYALYTATNMALNGRPMHENKDGKSLSLEIPLGEGRSFFLPYQFTIGTVPRRFIEAGGELAGGDIAGAAQKMSSFGSIPLNAAMTTLTNRNFYGAPISDEDGPTLVKAGKQIMAGAGQMMHPWGRTAVELATEQRTMKEAWPGLLELPLYPSASTDTAHLKGASRRKYNELSQVDPASAEAYSQRIMTEGKMKESKKAVEKQVQLKDGKKEQGFFAKMFGREPEEATPDMLSSYFGIDEYALSPETTAMQRAKKESDRQKIVSDILRDEDVLPEQKTQVLASLGESIDTGDIEYYQTAALD
ncbi:MAG: hypothetical protein GW914_01105, partial [Candidatus Aenigmarchaeota archaeon]|nr:hypothetical protein [Candidatus Aenigmarchaeota archaeon]